MAAWTWFTMAAGVWVAGFVLGVRSREPGRGRRWCRRCGYDMVGTPGLRCPECGRTVRSEKGLFGPRRHPKRVACATAMMLAALGCGMAGLFVRAPGAAWVLAPRWVLVATLDWPESEDRAEALSFKLLGLDEANRARVVPSALTDSGWGRLTAKCEKILTDPHRSSREYGAAVQLLAAVPDDKLVEPVVCRLLADADPGKRRNGVQAVVLRSHDAVLSAAVCEQLGDVACKDSAQVVGMAFSALARQDDPPAALTRAAEAFAAQGGLRESAAAIASRVEKRPASLAAWIAFTASLKANPGIVSAHEWAVELNDRISRLDSERVIQAPTPDAAWDAVFTRQQGWVGGDIAASIALPGNLTLWLFGDSLLAPAAAPGSPPVKSVGRPQGTTMVRNASAMHWTPTPGAALPPAGWTVSFDGALSEPSDWLVPRLGAPDQSVDASPQRVAWYWPMGDGIVGVSPEGSERLVLFVSRIGPRDGRGGMWDFQRVGGDMVIWPYIPEGPRPLDQEDCGFVVNPHVTPASGVPALSWGAACVREGEPGDPRATVYVYGVRTTAPGVNRLVLARAVAETIERPETWRFYQSGNDWSAVPAEAAPIADGLVDEFSVKRLDADGKSVLVLVQSEPMLGHRILMRTAPRPEGPWSQPRAIYTVPGLEDKRLMTYAAKAHPELSRRRELLISYVVNSTDFTQVMGDSSLYRPRFVRVPMGLVVGK
jgi:hypothetical protein